MSEWTERRLAVLEAVVLHLAPLSPAREDVRKASPATLAPRISPTEAVREALGRPSLAGQEIFLWAALDELDERGGQSFETLDETRREELLRGLEGDSDPYLAHALRLMLSLSLEARYSVRRAPGELFPGPRRRGDEGTNRRPKIECSSPTS